MRRRAFGVWAETWYKSTESGRFRAWKAHPLDEQNRSWYRLPSHAYMQYYIQSFRKKVDWISVVI